MAQSPAFKFYAKDFYTGTSDLTAEEAGVYTRGLAWSWDNGPLPLDDDRRARVLLAEKCFRRVWPAIEHLWTKGANGFTNDRLEAERSKQDEYRQAQANKGAKGGRPKAGGKPEESRGLSPGLPNQNPDTKPDESLAFALALPVDQNLHTPPARVSHPRNAFAPSLTQSPKAHMAHAFCSDRVKCVPKFMHDEFLAGIGGDANTRHERLMAWYGERSTEFNGETVGEAAPEFWRRLFKRDFASPRPASAPSLSPLSALLQQCLLPSGAVVWFGGAVFDGDTLTVRTADIAATIAERYLPELERKHGRRISIRTLEDAAVTA